MNHCNQFLPVFNPFLASSTCKVYTWKPAVQNQLCRSITLQITPYNPLCPRPPTTARSFSFLHDPRPPGSTLHTGIPVYANRNRILLRLVASFLLLFTTSGDDLCSKLGRVYEALWIFKVARRIHDRCTKIKSPTVSNGVGTSSFDIWTANLAQSLTVGTLTNPWSFIFRDSNWKFCSWLPHRHPKTWHSDADISDLGLFFLLLYFSVKKIQTCYIYKHNAFANWGKYKVS